MRRIVAAVAFASLTLTSSVAATPTDAPNDGLRPLATRTVDWVGDKQPYGLYDMVFRDRLVIAGAASLDAQAAPTGPEGGIVIYRILQRRPFIKQLSILRCQASGDITVVGDLLVAGVMQDHARDQIEPTRCNRNGLWLIDISQPRRPRVVKFIQFACGAVEHSLLGRRGHWYAFAPGTCHETVETPTNQGLYSEGTLVRLFPKRPRRSSIASHPEMYPSSCQELFVIAARELAGCVIDARFRLIDLSDPANPRTVEGSETEVTTAYLGRGAFTWDGQYAVLGSFRQCPPSGPQVDLFYFYNVEDPSNPVFVGSWAPDRVSDTDCFSRGFSVLPMKDPQRYVMAVGMGTLGISIVDFTDPTQPKEIAHHVPTFREDDSTASPVSALPARVWASYWYNGRIYATSDGEDIPRLRVLRHPELGRQDVKFFSNFYSPQTLIDDFR